MKRCTLITFFALLLIVACSSACQRKHITDEARQQAHDVEGNYDVTGLLVLDPYREGDTSYKRLNFSGEAYVTDLGDAKLQIQYYSYQHRDTNSIQIDIDESGILQFRAFNISYQGVDCRATMRESTLQRYGEDTISGITRGTLQIFTLSRGCSINLLAVRNPNL